jgi:hypothetical protein
LDPARRFCSRCLKAVLLRSAKVMQASADFLRRIAAPAT